MEKLLPKRKIKEIKGKLFYGKDLITSMYKDDKKICFWWLSKNPNKPDIYLACVIPTENKLYKYIADLMELYYK